MFVIRFDSKKFKNFNYNKIFNKILNKGIGINLHYLPIHLHPYYKKKGFKKGCFPNSEKYSAEAISIPIYYNLTRKEQLRVIKVIKEVISDQK